MTKKELLDDPAVSVLVNTLVLTNKAWIITVIARNINSRSHLRGSSVEELFSTALTGGGAVGGVMNAILEYDYEACGVAAFSHYLARAADPAERCAYLRFLESTVSVKDVILPNWR